MRLAIVSTVLHYPWGGPDKRWTALAEACQRRGDDVFLALSPLTAAHPRVQALVANGAQLFLRSGHSSYRGRIDALRRQIGWLQRPNMERDLARFRPDVVFLLQGGNMDCQLEHYLLDWCRRQGAPYILSASLARAQTSINEATGRQVVRDYTAAKAALFMSTENLRLTEQTLACKLTNARLIQNPLDLQVYDTGLADKETGGRPQLGFVGRLSIRHKGLDLLLEAMWCLRDEQEMELHLTGRCEDPGAFDALVAKHGLGDLVFRHEYTDPDRLAEAYHRADLMVLPSRWEGCASVMLEAMACGRPQLVTPVGGVDDWLTDGVDSFVAKDVSARAIEEALVRALAERHRWPAMGVAARQAFEAKRDPDPVQTLLGIVDGARV